MNTKTCTRCKQTKTTDLFPKSKSKSDGLDSWCKQCKKEVRQNSKEHIKEYNKQYKAEHKEEVSASRKAYYQEHQEEEKSNRMKYYYEHHDEELKTMGEYRDKNRDKFREYATEHRRSLGMKPMSENKECAQYLGVHLSENAASKLLPKATKMPINHPKYDFLCSQGYKIDVKSSTLRLNKNSVTPRWSFCIRDNKDADYFMCIGYDNRTDLNILKIWMIPRKEVDGHKFLLISLSNEVNWKEYELDPKEATQCVETIKESSISP